MAGSESGNRYAGGASEAEGGSRRPWMRFPVGDAGGGKGRSTCSRNYLACTITLAVMRG
jgi:hypothetical protein